MTLQQVLVETPKSKLTHKPNSVQKLSEKRTILREFRNQAQAEYDHVDEDLVMQHRMSFSQFDTMRKVLGLKSTPSRKRKCTAINDTTPIPPKRRHGNKPENMGFDTDRLLQEAKQWGEDESINWSQKPRSYGITKPNGGQIIKEFLADNGILLAQKNQRQGGASRQVKRKDKGGRISLAMHSPVAFQKRILKEKIDNKEILMGEEVVETVIKSYKVQKSTQSIVEDSIPVSARRIKLLEIRQKLLKEHEDLGIMKSYSDEYYESLPIEEVRAEMCRYGEEVTTDIDDEALRQKLITLSRTRHLKVWHDHADVASHGHFLVLVSAIFDPAIYYTTN